VNGRIQRSPEWVGHIQWRAHMRKMMILGSMILSLSMPATYASADQGGTHGHGKGTHMKVIGTISAIQSDLITVKTAWGQIRISSATAPKNLEVGEEVEMQVNENNAVPLEMIDMELFSFLVSWFVSGWPTSHKVT